MRADQDDQSMPVLLQGLELDIRSGETLFILGGQESGKSLLMRRIAGLIPGQGPGVTLDGKPFPDASNGLRAGYMPQKVFFRPRRRVSDVLVFFARLGGMDKGAASLKANEVMSLLGISDLSSSMTDSLSDLDVRRLALARALLEDPSVLVADDPFSALDEGSRAVMMDSIRSLQGKGVTMVVSGSGISDAEDLAKKVLLLKEGKRVRTISMSEIEESAKNGMSLDIELSNDPGIDMGSISGVSRYRSVGGGRYWIDIALDTDKDHVIDEIIWEIMNSGGSVRSVIPVTFTLEGVVNSIMDEEGGA